MSTDKHYDLCIFDLDGTLSDPKLGIGKSYQYALSHFGLHEEIDNLVQHIGAPLRDVFHQYFGLSDTDTEIAVEKYREYYTETGMYENTIYPGIMELLQTLADSSITMAVATSKVTAYTHIILDHFGLSPFFTFVSGDDMEGNLTKNGKLEIIRLALAHFAPDKKTAAVMIGDRMHDMRGAKENGIDGIGITWGYGDRAELEEAGADLILDKPEELVGYII